MKKTIRRALALCLILLTFCSLLPTAFAKNAVIDSGKTNTGAKWVLTNDGTLTFSGKSDIQKYDGEYDENYTYSDWTKYDDKIRRVVFSSGLLSTFGFDLYELSHVSDVFIGKTIEDIESYNLTACNSLKTISVEKGNPTFSVDQSAVLYNTETKTLVCFASKCALTSYNIKSGTKSIGESAFSNAKALKSVHIPDSVQSIPCYAFSGCYALSSITGGKGLRSVGACAFEDTLWYYQLPAGPAYLGNTLLAYIGPYTGNQTLKIKEGTVNVADNAFSDKHGFTRVSLPSSLNTIGWGAFSGTNLTTVTLPKKIKSLSSYTFSGCSDLKSVKFNEGLKGIGESAFYNCSALKSVTLPSTLSSLDYGVFSNTSISAVTLPKSLKSGAEDAFSEKTKFRVAAGNKAYSADKHGVLFNKNKSVLFAFPSAGTLTSYRVPSSVQTIYAGAFSNAAKLKTIQLPAKLKSIGDMAFSNCKALTKITLPDSVTDMGSSAFADCKNLKAVKLSANLKALEYEAFSGCKALKSIQLPGKLQSIEECVFKNCKQLTAVSVPGSVEIIGWNAFENCKALKKVTLSEGVKFIRAEAFLNCKALTAITLPKSLVFLDNSAFTDCKYLTTITVKNAKLHIEYPDESYENEQYFPSGVTFCAATGSSAETYCKLFNLKFKAA